MLSKDFLAGYWNLLQNKPYYPHRLIGSQLIRAWSPPKEIHLISPVHMDSTVQPQAGMCLHLEGTESFLKYTPRYLI